MFDSDFAVSLPEIGVIIITALGESGYPHHSSIEPASTILEIERRFTGIFFDTKRKEHTDGREFGPEQTQKVKLKEANAEYCKPCTRKYK